MKSFGFVKTASDRHSHARCGVITTPHGKIKTPAFVPVGTQATVKSLTPDELKACFTDLFFVNTYHMVMRPGLAVIQACGGLHAFMGWDKPLITDSGGFQVFSLGSKRFARKNENGEGEASLVKISDNSVVFRSHWDGSVYEFTPEFSMESQWMLGSDIHIAFDDCTPFPVTFEKAEISMKRTHAWAARSMAMHQKLAKRAYNGPYQALYGSIQGSIYEPLRHTSAECITHFDFDGYAIGGVSVGESKQDMENVLSWVTPHLPLDKPRHLLGVGEIDDIFTLVSYGIDTFDCVQATRLARTGNVYVSPKILKSASYTLDITKTDYANDFLPIDSACGCYTCQHFTRAYLHHLFRVRELLSYRLASIHNIFFIQNLLKEIRSAIADERFVELQKQWLYNRI